jgi:hypothetical protein
MREIKIFVKKGLLYLYEHISSRIENKNLSNWDTTTYE